MYDSATCEYCCCEACAPVSATDARRHKRGTLVYRWPAAGTLPPSSENRESKTSAPTTGIAAIQRRKQAVLLRMCDIVPLGNSVLSGAVGVVVRLSPAYPFSLARGTV